MQTNRLSPELEEARLEVERAALPKYVHDPNYSGGYVTFKNGPPCIIIDTWDQEAQIRSIIDGTEYVIAKNQLIDAEVNIVVKG